MVYTLVSKIYDDRWVKYFIWNIQNVNIEQNLALAYMLKIFKVNLDIFYFYNFFLIYFFLYSSVFLFSSLDLAKGVMVTNITITQLCNLVKHHKNY